jgi:FimV-like protein
LAILARNPSSKRALMGLAAHYAERKNAQGFDEIAQRIYRLSGGRGPNWTHIAAIGRELDPDNRLYALEAGDTEEAESSPDDETQASAASADETSHAALAPEGLAPLDTDTDTARADETPAPATQVSPIDTPAAESGAASRSEAEDRSLEEAPAKEAVPTSSESDEPPTSAEPATLSQPAAAAAPEGEATLPPEAIAALGGLDIGLPPRVGTPPDDQGHMAQAQADAEAEAEAEAQEPGEPLPQESQALQEERAAEHTAHIDPSAHEVSAPTAPAEHEGESDAKPEGAPAVAPAVTGLGAAPVGRLKLSFDLDLPGAQAGEGERDGEQGDITPVPQFTPEQLARIARNKLDLAAEYIALGDLGGARTLIHEVIDSNDAATHDEAHAMLATLAPLS